MEFAKVRGEIHMRQTEAMMTMAEVDAIGRAAEEQGKTARAAGEVIAGISALVRPIVTYAFVGTYFLVKFAAYLLALDQNGDWRVVLLDLWNKDDMAMLSMILSFWFLSRLFLEVSLLGLFRLLGVFLKLFLSFLYENRLEYH